MTSFKISNLWQHKQKHHATKSKPAHSTQNRTALAKDEWDMSPEDALRISYSGHK